jgi:hypothetical protein
VDVSVGSSSVNASCKHEIKIGGKNRATVAHQTNNTHFKSPTSIFPTNSVFCLPACLITLILRECEACAP